MSSINLRNMIVDLHPDICYQRNAGAETGVVAWTCKSLDRPFVFGSSSMWNATNDLHVSFRPGSIGPHTRLFYRYGLSRSAAIVAQTREITKLFQREFPTSDVRHIPSAAISVPPAVLKDPKFFAVSITRFVWYRRPLLVLQLAQGLPDVQFVLAGYGPLQAEIEQLARAIPNVRLVGRVTPDEGLVLMKRASVFVNTSMIEGFPNTLLESLVCETPYLSFYDPDEIICRYGLGAHAKTLDDMASAVLRYSRDAVGSTEFASRAHQYLSEFHNPDFVANEYERLFAEKLR